jgi:hypothetical protein
MRFGGLAEWQWHHSTVGWLPPHFVGPQLRGRHRGHSDVHAGRLRQGAKGWRNGRSRQSEEGLYGRLVWKACMEGLYGRFLRPRTLTPSLSHGQRSNSAIAPESESVCHDCRPAVHVLTVLREYATRPGEYCRLSRKLKKRRW